jgi:hypothetical protein
MFKQRLARFLTLFAKGVIYANVQESIGGGVYVRGAINSINL